MNNLFLYRSNISPQNLLKCISEFYFQILRNPQICETLFDFNKCRWTATKNSKIILQLNNYQQVKDFLRGLKTHSTEILFYSIDCIFEVDFKEIGLEISGKSGCNDFIDFVTIKFVNGEYKITHLTTTIYESSSSNRKAFPFQYFVWKIFEIFQKIN